MVEYEPEIEDLGGEDAPEPEMQRVTWGIIFSIALTADQIVRILILLAVVLSAVALLARYR